MGLFIRGFASAAPTKRFKHSDWSKLDMHLYRGTSHASGPCEHRMENLYYLCCPECERQKLIKLT